MDAMNSNQGAPIGQGQNDQIQILHNLVQSLLQLIGPSAPAIIPGALYTRPQVENNLGMSPQTTTLWIDHGLKPYRAATRADLFMGDDVIEFVKMHDGLKHPKDYKAKVEQRKRGRKA